VIIQPITEEVGKESQMCIWVSTTGKVLMYKRYSTEFTSHLHRGFSKRRTVTAFDNLRLMEIILRCSSSITIFHTSQ